MHAVDAAVSAVTALGNTWGCYRIVPAKARPKHGGMLLGKEILVITGIMGEGFEVMGGSALLLVLECKQEAMAYLQHPVGDL